MAFSKGDLANLLFLALAFAFLWLAHRLAAWRLQSRHGVSQDSLITEGNDTALSLRLMGLFLGLALGLSGPLSAPGRNLLADLLGMLWVGGLVMLLMFAAWWVNHRLILSGIDNTGEIVKGNVAVGLVELGSLTATGLILRGAFSGQGTVISGVVFFILGQAAQVLFFRLLQMLTPYDDQKEIAQGNLALGLHCSGMLVALGLVVAAGVTGDFTHWGRDLMDFAWATLKGMALLLAASAITDRLFLRHTTAAQEIARDKNPAAVLVCLGVKLSLAILIVHTMV